MAEALAGPSTIMAHTGAPPQMHRPHAPIAATSAASPVHAAADFTRRFESRKTSMALAYFLLGILGMWGGHRFYLGKTGSAVAMLCCTLFSVLTMIIVIGFFTIWISWVIWFVDACTMHRQVRERNLRLIDELERSMAV